MGETTDARAPRTVVLATRNPAKLAELRRILAAAVGEGHEWADGGAEIELVDLEDRPDVADVAEVGATFAENALLKARAAAQVTGLPAVADDSGLQVDALNGMPGVLSARWAGRHGDDEANLRLVLAQTADVPDERRGAAFVCAAAVVLPDGTERVVQGRLQGRLTREPRGDGGFGYDPIFLPDGHRRTTAQMPPADKDAISHRGQAFRMAAQVLRQLLGGGGGA